MSADEERETWQVGCGYDARSAHHHRPYWGLKLRTEGGDTQSRVSLLSVPLTNVERRAQDLASSRARRDTINGCLAVRPEAFSPLAGTRTRRMRQPRA